MTQDSRLDDIFEASSALERGQRLGQLAAKAGFDWPSALDALEKVFEEAGELEELLEHDSPSRERLKDELGDLLFAVVNVARKLELDAEGAMELTNQKFGRRFRFIEAEADKKDRRLEEMELDEMEELWQLAKGQEMDSKAGES